VGSILRAARERQGLSVQEAAGALNLKPLVIEALEGDRYDLMPPRTFVKGYLRAYAKLVGVKEADVLAAYEQQQPEPAPEPVQSALPSSEDGAAGSVLKWTVLAVALLLLGYVAYNAYPPRETDRLAVSAVVDDAPPQALSEEPSAPAAPPPREEASEPVSAQRSEPAEQSPPQVLEPAPVSGASAPPAVSQPEPQEATEADAPDTSSTPSDAGDTPDASGALPKLVIAVDGESWLEVRDATGARRHVSLVQGPRTLRIDGTPPFSLVIGNAAAVEVRYAGEPIPLAPHTRGRVARLSVPPPP
jgi:cytoskeleton protein RodZ